LNLEKQLRRFREPSYGQTVALFAHLSIELSLLYAVIYHDRADHLPLTTLLPSLATAVQKKMAQQDFLRRLLSEDCAARIY
jgi:hypothetical protein